MCADDLAVTAMFFKLSLFIIYLGTDIGRLQHCLWDWRIFVNIAKSHARLHDAFKGADCVVSLESQCSW
jgi:hypothetical protein